MIIFLDIEGVLYPAPWAVGQPPGDPLWPHTAKTAWRQRRLDQLCVGRLRRLVDETQASIVLTSDWRHRMSTIEFVRLLAYYEFESAPIIGATPALIRASRGEEVAAWRSQNGSLGKYVCIDDDRDFLPDQPLVQTRSELGLTDDDIIRALAFLSGSGQKSFQEGST